VGIALRAGKPWGQSSERGGVGKKNERKSPRFGEGKGGKGEEKTSDKGRTQANSKLTIRRYMGGTKVRKKKKKERKGGEGKSSHGKKRWLVVTATLSRGGQQALKGGGESLLKCKKGGRVSTGPKKVNQGSNIRGEKRRDLATRKEDFALG